MPLSVAEDAFKKVAQEQRDSLTELAERIERGEALHSELERRLAAGAIRAHASTIPDGPRRGRGQQSRFPHGEVALRFAALVAGPANKSENAAHEDLATEFDVSVNAIKRAIATHGDAAFALLESFGIRRPPRHKAGTNSSE